MKNWIDENYEKNIKKWYACIKEEQSEEIFSLYIKLNDSNDLFCLQNFFLICLKETEKKFRLEIRCKVQDEFRVKHYLFACKNLATEIMINGKIFDYTKDVNFFRILPLISVNRDNYEFLAMKIFDIEDRLGMQIGSTLLSALGEEDKFKKELTIEQKFLLRTSMTCLYGNISGLKKLADIRRDYFEDNQFRDKVCHMPFLAFLIFCYYDRLNHEERANEYKEEKRKRTNKRHIHMNAEEMSDALPYGEEIQADIFNAWDISDGILQLLENIVEHAGDGYKAKDGSGVLTIRIHNNINENAGFKKEYEQYFYGYENKYKSKYEIDGRDRSEKDYFKECHDALQSKLNKGMFTDEEVVNDYRKIREIIEKRREERKEVKYFLDIRIADMSGKYMCNVFKNNLREQGYGNDNCFQGMKVRSFFDPNSQEKREFDAYYKGKNIIHHYGLQIFTSVIVNNDGYFFVRSHSEKEGSSYDTTQLTKDSELELLMEGTRYQILLPIHRQKMRENSMVNANISYNSAARNTLKIIDTKSKMIKKFYKRLYNYDRTKELKLEAVQRLCECLEWKKDVIYVFI